MDLLTDQPPPSSRAERIIALGTPKADPRGGGAG
ncbi:hypothetical protein H4W32_001341 [Actinophytocola algeriensis]|uniref:Uncharacterized protein n=1 Tax=Actinophytocola algeriensis TaxID=1768010 RepID=A0A7W7VIQ9_9PSEU|nr:hypothetical protein [Actinophytocola algeriensis]MBE1473299.1 hypothetical protein [Actinophytocola algeriensis]